ncbi:MAG: type I 3-dehydroquinate dehydratase [Deltaproteobacteria bacterium]|nr:type I 3-dehydroquinate dehydratase [Deltaproteobacteria bacterium]
MLCVTGGERGAAELCARLAAVAARLGSGEPFLQEVRLDLLERVDEAVFDLVAKHRAVVVVCCRPARQDGGYDGDERERLALLARVGRLGVAYVDVEADVEDGDLCAMSQAGGSRPLLSWHEKAARPADLAERLCAMAARGPDAVKLAVPVDDAAELAALLEAGRAIDIPKVLVGVGEAGLLSRTHYRSFGSAWTYVAASTAVATAEGQLDLDRALVHGMPATSSGPLCALVGGENVMRSPGPAIYNRWLRRHASELTYVAVLTRKLGDTLALLERLGARGASVTMPLKREALRLCAPDDLARLVGAVNSLRRRSGRWEGTNTDVWGVRAPLARALLAAGLGTGAGAVGARALVLGAGGAAAAAALACEQIGLAVCLSARRREAAEELAARGRLVVPWDERADAPCDVLVNATPIGGAQSPWPAGRSLGKRIVFDLAMPPAARPGAPDTPAPGSLARGRSQLCAQAEHEGAVALGALEMWLCQGARQIGWILGREIDPDSLRELAACL